MVGLWVAIQITSCNKMLTLLQLLLLLDCHVVVVPCFHLDHVLLMRMLVLLLLLLLMMVMHRFLLLIRPRGRESSGRVSQLPIAMRRGCSLLMRIDVRSRLSRLVAVHVACLAGGDDEGER